MGQNLIDSSVRVYFSKGLRTAFSSSERHSMDQTVFSHSLRLRDIGTKNGVSTLTVLAKSLPLINVTFLTVVMT